MPVRQVDYGAGLDALGPFATFSDVVQLTWSLVLQVDFTVLAGTENKSSPVAKLGRVELVRKKIK